MFGFGKKKDTEKMQFDTPFHPGREKTYLFKGGLELVRTGDGHKRPMIGGPTKGWIVFKAAYKGKKKELYLYAEGVQGSSEPDRYEPVEWQGFVFQQAGEGNIVVRRKKQ